MCPQHVVCSQTLAFAKSHLVKKRTSFDTTAHSGTHGTSDWTSGNSTTVGGEKDLWREKIQIWIYVMINSLKGPERLHILWHPTCNRRGDKNKVVKAKVTVVDLWSFEVLDEKSMKRNDLRSWETSEGQIIATFVQLHWKTLWMQRLFLIEISLTYLW